MSLEIVVSGFSGHLCNVAGHKSWHASQVKAKVEAASGIPSREQRLVCGQVEVNDFTNLGSLLPAREGKENNASSNLMLNLLRRSAEQAAWIENLRLAVWEFSKAPDHIRADPDVALAAFRQGPILKYASEELRSDREFVKKLLLYSPCCAREFSHVPVELRSDREIVGIAVPQFPKALGLAADHLRSDFDFVFSLVKKHGLALKYASLELQADRRIVCAAVQNYGNALQYAAKHLRQDASVVLMAVRCHGDALRHASPVLRANRDVVAAAVCKDVSSFQYVADELQSDAHVALAIERKLRLDDVFLLNGKLKPLLRCFSIDALKSATGHQALRFAFASANT